MLDNGRVVMRRIYRVEGTLVTLDERQPAADEAAKAANLLRQDAPSAAPAPRDSAVAPVNSIRWVDARGAEFTLSGAVSAAQLEQIRTLLGY